MDIKNLSDSTLLDYFKQATCDENYNPSSIPYNQSGFTLQELEDEVLSRMSKSLDGSKNTCSKVW